MGNNNGEKTTRPDISEKRLLAINDVFADVINVFVYHGRQMVSPEDLVAKPSSSKYHAATGEMHENMRDVCKEWKKGDVSFCIFGLENQSFMCRTMPVRVMGYDYASYKAQVDELRRQNKKSKTKVPYGEELLSHQRLIPVITLVLYFGMDHWTGPRSLYELIDVSDELKPFIPDYPITVVEIAYMEPEEIGLFRSDFKVLADIVRATRLHSYRELCYTGAEVKYAFELMDTLKVLANKKMLLSFETRIRELQDMEVTEMTFVDIFEEELKRREAESNAESEAKGRAKQLLSLVNQNIITKEVAVAQFGGTFAELEAVANK